MQLISNNTGNWEIYRTIDEETSEAFVVRFPRHNFGTKIDSYLANYKTIQKLGIPTLNLVEKYEINNMVGIRTEDLNYMQDKLYITYNSLYSDSRKMVDILSQNIIKRNTEKKSPEYEEFRYSNKLSEITNLEQFIVDTTKDLRSVSRQGVLIDLIHIFSELKKRLMFLLLIIRLWIWTI